MRTVVTLSLGVLAVLAPALAHATGVKNSENGAVAVGMADAFVAIADDATAIYYNPAAITKLEGTHFSLGVSPMYPTTTFEAGADLPGGTKNVELAKGDTANNVSGINPLPHLYVTQQVPDSTVAVGIGIYLPYATGLEWEEGWAGRGQSLKTQVAAGAFNPNIAWAITPALSVAAGFSMLQSALEAKQVLRGSIGDPREDVLVNIGAEGQALAGNAALLWDINDSVAFGASYRTAAKVEMTGGADFTIPNSAYAEFFPDQDVTTVFRFPDVLNAGFGYAPHEDWKLDAEVEFARNNVNEELVVKFEEGKPANQIVQKTKWRNTLSYRLGANYIASSRWDFRAGAAFDQTPVPDETLGPASSDADRIIGALGASYHWRRNVFSLGAQLQHFLPREVTEKTVAAGAPDLPGTYETELAVVSFTWSTSLR